MTETEMAGPERMNTLHYTVNGNFHCKNISVAEDSYEN